MPQEIKIAAVGWVIMLAGILGRIRKEDTDGE